MVNLYIRQGQDERMRWDYMGQFSTYDAALFAAKKLAVLTSDIRIFNI